MYYHEKITEETLIMALDVGNAQIKARAVVGPNFTDERMVYELSFDHSFRQIASGQYEQVLDRNDDAPVISNWQPRLPFLRIRPDHNEADYFDFVPYAFGRQSETYGEVSLQSGASRYTKDYYGVLAVSAIVDAIAHYRSVFGDDSWSPSNVVLKASHAPIDIKYRSNLQRSIGGRWQVRAGRKDKMQSFDFLVSTVATYEEPVGGMWNHLLDYAGDANDASWERFVSENSVAVIDIGGKTISGVGYLPGIELAEGMVFSLDGGINRAIQEFKLSMQRRHADKFQHSNSILEDQWRSAFRTGCFIGGGDQIDVSDIADEAKQGIINRVRSQWFDRMGGPLRWQLVILTGGGAALMYDDLVNVLEHNEDYVRLAEVAEYAHLANVRGGMKSLAMQLKYNGEIR